MKLCHSSI